MSYQPPPYGHRPGHAAEQNRWEGYGPPGAAAAAWTAGGRAADGATSRRRRAEEEWDHPTPGQQPDHRGDPGFAPSSDTPRSRPFAWQSPGAPAGGWATGYPDENPSAAGGPPQDPYRLYGQDPSPEELEWAEIRTQAVAAVQRINRTHCAEAFSRVGRPQDELAPNGVVLFYAVAEQPSAPPTGPGQPRKAARYRVHTVVRNFLSGGVGDNAEKALTGLTKFARKSIAEATKTGIRWDPRGPAASMVNAGDFDMPKDALFVGTALETLNTPQQDWYAVAKQLQADRRSGGFSRSSPLTVGGQALVLLIDDTHMHVTRDPNRSTLEREVRTTKTLNPYERYAPIARDLTEEPATRRTWAPLTELHTTLAEYLNGTPT